MVVSFSSNFLSKKGRNQMSDIPLASNLVGKQVGKWFVKEKRIKEGEDNSGAFSSGYTVVDADGQLAFMKAFNYLYAFKIKGKSADTLNWMTGNYKYERELLNFCSEYKMRRVVTAIDSGEYNEPDQMIPVPYLVFELAQGNLTKVRALENPDLTWKLKSFHGALVGLSQLHFKMIAHQDIKPSNILIFGNEVSKISDLGCATQFRNESDWQGGDTRYMPVELLYKHINPDWEIRRFGADVFMMGGLLTFLLADSNFLSLMMSKIPVDFRPFNFGGTFEQAKPYIMKAYYDTLDEIGAILHPAIRSDILQIISEMTHPIPEKRGNPQNLPIIKHKRFFLQKYISIADRLSKQVSWGKI